MAFGLVEIVYVEIFPRSFGDQVISLRQGPMLIGFLFNVLLYGMMIAQVYVYYTTYKRFVFCF